MSYKERAEQKLLDTLSDSYDDTSPQSAVAPKAEAQPQPAQQKAAANSSIYIDGENTFFQLFDTLRYKRLVRYRDDLVKFDMDWLIQEVLGTGQHKMLYYGAKLREEDSTPELLERTRRMIDHKRRWIGYLSNQGVEFVTAGELRIRDTSNAGEEANLTFAEKGVDVRMAVDMIEAAASEPTEQLVLMSGDADLAPVVPAIQRHGVKVTYLAFEGRINDHIAGSVDQTKVVENKHILEAFKRAN